MSSKMEEDRSYSAREAKTKEQGRWSDGDCSNGTGKVVQGRSNVEESANANAWFLDARLAAQAEAAKKKDNLGKASSFARAVASLAPPSHFHASAQETLSAVKAAVQQVHGEKARVKIYGSLIQGTFLCITPRNAGVYLLASDLDLCMEKPGMTETDEVTLAGQVAALQPLSVWVRLQKKIPAVSLQQKLPKPFLEVTEERFYNKQNMYAKLPILMLNHTSSIGSKVKTDLSAGVVIEGVEKGFTDRIIRRVLARAPRALHMSRAIKFWGKVERLNKTFEGFLNPTGWTLLVIFFFMQRGEVEEDWLEEEEPNERGSDDGTKLPPPLDSGSEDNVPKPEEFADFFDMVASFEPGTHLSLVDGSMVNVPAIEEPWSDKVDFFLEDPGVKLRVNRSQNVADALRKEPLQKTKTMCREAAIALRSESATDAEDWVAGLFTKCEAAAYAKLLVAAPAALERPWEARAAQPECYNFFQVGNFDQMGHDSPFQYRQLQSQSSSKGSCAAQTSGGQQQGKGKGKGKKGRESMAKSAGKGDAKAVKGGILVKRDGGGQRQGGGGGQKVAAPMLPTVQPVAASREEASTEESRWPVVKKYRCCLRPKNGKIRFVSYRKAPLEESELTKEQRTQNFRHGDQEKNQEDRPSLGCHVEALEIRGDWMLCRSILEFRSDDHPLGWLPIKKGDEEYFKLSGC